jgi:hypothetical protein
VTSGEWRRAEAKVRMLRALSHIQRAQDELGKAAGVLSSLQYGHPAQAATMRVYDRVKEVWYRVNALLVHPKVQVDREPTPGELARANSASPGGAP